MYKRQVPGEAIELHDGSATSFDEFQKKPSAFLSTVEWDDADDHVHWTYQVRPRPPLLDVVRKTLALGSPLRSLLATVRSSEPAGPPPCGASKSHVRQPVSVICRVCRRLLCILAAVYVSCACC